MYEIQSINHLEKVSFMLHALQDKPVITNFVLSFAEQSQDLEDMFRQLLEERSLDTAVGVQLDIIGYLVDELRQGRNDEEFLKSIKLRIAINSSSGTVTDIINVTRLLLDDNTVNVIVFRSAPAQITLFIDSDEAPVDFEDTMRQVIAAGVKLDRILYPSDRLPLIFTEQGAGGVEGILPEEGSNNPLDRVFVEEI